MRITKVYFPSITVIRLEEVGVEPRYYSQIPGEPTYPSEDVVVTERDWQRVMREATLKNARIEIREE